MQILLANAKIMFGRSEHQPMSTPRFQAIAETFAKEMAGLDIDDMSQLMGCNRKLAAETVMRYKEFMASDKMPAIMAYNGQAYKHLQAGTLSNESLKFAQEHLWITCFLYGMLRPLDGIVPYRMEHTVSLRASDDIPMNRFWRERLTTVLTDSVTDDDGTLIHLSTGEYEQLFNWKEVCRNVKVIQPLFYIRKSNGELKMQAVWAKACRGAMTRFIIKNKITNPDDIKAFAHEGFQYVPQLGEENFPHFVREEA